MRALAAAAAGLLVGTLLVPPAAVPTRRPPVAPALVGEWLYLRRPQLIVAAIRRAEGVPSYGILPLADLAGGHQFVAEARGRQLAAVLVHAVYRDWVRAGRPDDFLVFLSRRWAPIGAANDPTDLNRFWLQNVLAAVPDDVMAAFGRGLVLSR